MAYYLNKRMYCEGNLILYQRDLDIASPGAKNRRPQAWYMKIRIKGAKRAINRSTRITTPEDAYAFAYAEYLRLSHAVQQGYSLDEYTFEQHWDKWFDSNVSNGNWKSERANWHKKYANRYFKPYFRHADGRSMLLNEITPEIAISYWDWRIGLWASNAGKKIIKSNPKRKGAKTTITANTKSAPAPKTLQMEQSALNQIFSDASQRGRLQKIILMKAPKNNKGVDRRPHFEDDELRSLRTSLLNYRDCKGHFKKDRLNKWGRLQRKQLYHFVLFMLNSGLRVGEAREMRWRDIKFDVETGSLPEPIAVVTIRKATKAGKARDVQTQPGGNKTLLEWRQITQFKGKDDLVWFGQQKISGAKQVPFSDLNKSFQNFLIRAPFEDRAEGLLFSKENERRSLYSLRHTYATQRIEKGDVSVYDLSLNMGCKIAQIEKHYSHSNANRRRAEITKSKTYEKALKKAEASIGTGDTFLDQAFAEYKAGRLSKIAFSEILDRNKGE